MKEQIGSRDREALADMDHATLEKGGALADMDPGTLNDGDSASQRLQSRIPNGIYYQYNCRPCAGQNVYIRSLIELPYFT